MNRHRSRLCYLSKTRSLGAQSWLQSCCVRPPTTLRFHSTSKSHMIVLLRKTPKRLFYDLVSTILLCREQVQFHPNRVFTVSRRMPHLQQPEKRCRRHNFQNHLQGSKTKFLECLGERFGIFLSSPELDPSPSWGRRRRGRGGA